jgi:MraZ protein
VVVFRGRYEHTLDDRGRVALPARYREEFKGNIVLTLSQEGCIEVYPEAAFLQMSNEVASQPATTVAGRRSRRLFDARSHDTELDRQGRILIPARFREVVGLNGAVTIIGRRECLEIWDPPRLEKELAEAETMASSAGQAQE